MRKNKDEYKNSENSIISVIPQVFYDFIARFIPGCLIILAGFITYYGSIDNAMEIVILNRANLPCTLISVCIGFVFSYGIAIILWRQIDWLRMLGIFKKNKPFLTKRYSAYERIDLYMYDYIKTRNYAVGSRITKHRAEKHMSEILATGLIYCFVYNTIQLLLHVRHPDMNRIVLELFISFFILGAGTSHVYFCKRLESITRNYYILYHGPDIKKIHHRIVEMDQDLKHISKKKMLSSQAGK